MASYSKMSTCDICYKEFSLKKNMIVHRRIHTGEKPYSCDLCGMAFSCRQYLYKHKISHTGEKKYSCDICSKKFAYPGSLSDHRKKHTGEKPFSCVICAKAFSNSSLLNAHKNSPKHLKLVKMASKTLIDYPHDNITEENEDDSYFTIDNTDPMSLVECKLEVEKETDGYPLDNNKEENEDVDNFIMNEASIDNEYPLSPLVECNLEIEEETEGVLCTPEIENIQLRNTETNTCEVCNQQFAAKSYLIIHRRTHT